MNAEKTCGVCRFVRPYYSTRGDAEQGRASLSTVECHIRSTPGDFPFRAHDDWCGEFEPREEPRDE